MNRAEAERVRTALETDPRTRDYAMKLEDAGEGHATCWPTLRVPKPNTAQARNAAVTIAQDVLGREVKPGEIVIAPLPVRSERGR